jgi:hypothetical protein
MTASSIGKTPASLATISLTLIGPSKGMSLSMSMVDMLLLLDFD